MIKILHAADLHVDSPLSTLPAIARARRKELVSLPGRLVSLAAEEEIPIILISGDLFDRGEKTTVARTVIDALARSKARIFIAPGNHDPYTQHSPYALYTWPENVHIFKSTVPERVRLPEFGISVWGMGFTDENVTTPLLAGFHVPDDGDIHICVVHGETGAPLSRYNPISAKDIAASRLDYLALGHVHQHGGIMKEGKTLYAWPGCPEGRGFDETGERGIITGEIGKGNGELNFRPFAARRYRIIGTGGVVPNAELLAGLERDIVRLVLEGESVQDAETVRETLAGMVYHLTVEDRTVPAGRDFWQREGEENLIGLYLSALKERLASEPNPEKRRIIELAARYGVEAMEDGEVEDL